MTEPLSPTMPRLRILWSFARHHRRTLVIGLLLSLIGSALGLSTPMVTKWVLDSLAGSASLTGPILALLGLLVVGAVVSFVNWTLLGSLGERIVLEARESIVRRFLRATVPALGKHPTGELVTRVTSDTVLLREAAASSVIGLINAFVMLIGTLVLMSVLDLVLLGTTLLVVAVVVALFALLMPSIAKAQERAQEHVGKLGGVLEGTLRAIRTVKVSRAEGRQADRVLGHARSSAEQGIVAVRREAAVWIIAWTGIQVAIIVILGVGAWRVSAGALEVSSLIAFLLYAFGLMEPITELSQNLTALQSGIAAAQRIRDLDALETETTPGRATTGTPAPAQHVSEAGSLLELRNVTAAYGPGLEPAVQDVTLTIPARGHTAIVGPSGAGKTTLFSLVLRFLEPTNGALFLDGRPYRDLTYDEIRSRLAYVEQDTPVLPGTIRENLLLSHPDATEQELLAVLEDVRLLDKVRALDEGLDTPLTSSSVSGGERQRIALARALLRTPDLLLLDEATAQLDGLTEAAIHDAVQRRAASGAVVTIAHRLSTVIEADTILVMEAGRIRAAGSHQELLGADALYARLVEALRIATPAAGLDLDRR